MSQVPPGTRGLFNGFEGYRTATDADYERLLRQGLVVLDTNVLLDLYRMNRKVRGDMLTVLMGLRDRVWLPHQVLVEFWRNQPQEAILRHHSNKAKQARESMAKAGITVQNAINTWMNDVHLDDDDTVREQLNLSLGGMKAALAELSRVVDEQATRDGQHGAPDTNEDEIIRQLERIFADNVGPAPTAADLNTAVIEAKSRAEKQTPPGYKDFEAGKADPDAAGDYILWRQTLAEATARNCDILLVTRDLKEDWWRPTVAGAPRQPRVELVHEALAVADCRLFMLEPSSLMSRARRVLKLEDEVDERSVQALERLETEVTRDGDLWDATSLEALLDALFATSYVQAEAILSAADNDGFVTREAVYDIGGYDASRMLRGFTRPVKTATRKLQEAGVATGDPEELLVAEYEGGVLATGFSIPPYTVPILHRLAALYRDGDLREDLDGGDQSDE